MSILNEQGGASLRDALNASSRNRQLDNAIRRDESVRAAVDRQGESEARRHSVVEAAARVQLELAEIADKRVEGAHVRAEDRAREKTNRSNEVRSALEAANAVRLADASIAAERRAADRATLSVSVESIRQKSESLLTDYASARANLRADLAAFSAQMRRRDGSFDADAIARSISQAPKRAPNPREIARRSREAIRQGVPQDAQPAQPTGKEGALNTAPLVRSPVERRRESIVQKLIAGRPGASLDDLVSGLGLENGEVTTILKRLTAEQRVELRDGGYHSISKTPSEGESA